MPKGGIEPFNEGRVNLALTLRGLDEPLDHPTTALRHSKPQVVKDVQPPSNDLPPPTEEAARIVIENNRAKDALIEAIKGVNRVSWGAVIGAFLFPGLVVFFVCACIFGVSLAALVPVIRQTAPNFAP